MKTLYLHIGTPKTATSSIQKFCWINQEELHKYNYCFPILPQVSDAIVLRRNAHFLISPPKQSKYGSQAKKRVHARIEEGLATLHEAFCTYNNLILSDESIWRAVNYNWENPLEILKKDAEEHGYELRVIVYLRRQDAFASSNWNQRVKKTGHTDSFDQYLNMTLTLYPLILDYGASLDIICDIVGQDHITVRRFEPETWVNHSIYSDFLDAIHMDPDTPLTIPDDVNPGLKGNATEIQRLLNADTVLSSEDHLYLASYIKELSVYSGQNYPCNPMSVDEIQTLLARFEDSNKHVAEAYIGDGKPLFSEVVKDIPKWTDNNPQMWKDHVILFSSVTMDLYRENQKLQEKISSMDEKYVRKSSFVSFKDKLKHPFRTLWRRIFRKADKT